MAVMSKGAVLLALGELCHIAHTATQDYVCSGAMSRRAVGELEAPHCNTLQHIATHRNTPQHTAIHCNTLLALGRARGIRLSHDIFIFIRVTWLSLSHDIFIFIRAPWLSFAYYTFIFIRVPSLSLSHDAFITCDVTCDVWCVTWRVTWLTGARAVQLYLGELEALVFHNAARALLVWEPGAISQKLWSSISRSSLSAISRRAGGSCFPQRCAHLARA